MPGLAPAWSRLVPAPDAEGVLRTWHVLDSGAPVSGAIRGTLLCVHGNPTWSYLWRSVVAAGPAQGWRVVAVDQLGMGWSERPGSIAHDWGGVISLGWALRHLDRLAGVILTNTAVSTAGSAAPPAIRLARAPRLLRLGTVTTPAFLETTLALAHPRLSREVAAAYRSPYASASRRGAIGAFVADIPLEPDHPSAPALAEVEAGLGAFADVPALLLWGPRDPVFSDRYLRDLRRHLPHADVHRVEGAGHLIAEDFPLPSAIFPWLAAALPNFDHPGGSTSSRRDVRTSSSLAVDHPGG